MKEKKAVDIYHPCSVTRNHKCGITMRASFRFILVQTILRFEKKKEKKKESFHFCAHQPDQQMPGSRVGETTIKQ